MGYAYRVDRIAIRETADASGCTPEELYSETYPDYKGVKYYALNRATEYPKVEEIMDGMIKAILNNDKVELQAIQDVRLAIKAKIPKV